MLNKLYYGVREISKASNPRRKDGEPSNYILRYDDNDDIMHFLVPQEKQTRCADSHQNTRSNKWDVWVYLKCDII